METADSALTSTFGIDFVWFSSYNWDSGPDNSRPVCGTNGLLEELVSEFPRGGADTVVGFSNNASSGTKGCSVGNHALLILHGQDAESRHFNSWTTLQHEFSHFLGATDAYPDPNNTHTNDVMENQYAYPNYWCFDGVNHNGQVMSHAGKYD